MKYIILAFTFFVMQFTNGQGKVTIHNYSTKPIKVSMLGYRYNPTTCKQYTGYVESIPPGGSPAPTTYEKVINSGSQLILDGYTVNPTDPGYPTTIFNSYRVNPGGAWITSSLAETSVGNPVNPIPTNRSMWGYFKITIFNSIPGTPLESLALYTPETKSPQVVGGVTTNWHCHNGSDTDYGQAFNGVIMYNGIYEWDLYVDNL